MRRSKSNPAKYARNYKSISQRQMTKYDNVNDEDEMKRLKNILKHSKDHLKKHDVGNDDADDGNDDGNDSKKKGTKKRKVSDDYTDNNTATVEASTKDNQSATADEPEDEDMAFERARNMLRNSTDHLRPETTAVTDASKGKGKGNNSNNNDMAEDEEEDDAMQLKPLKKGKKRNRKSDAQEDDKDKNKSTTKKGVNDEDTTKDSSKSNKSIAAATKSKNDASHLVTDDFLAELKTHPTEADDNLENPLVVLPNPNKNKKNKNKKSKMELTPEEIKQARQLQKKTQRKLTQLAVRSEQKKKRADLYEKLQKTAISAEEMALLSSSSTLGKRVSKKEQLKKLIRKERAGMTLTEDERELLYRDRNSHDSDSDNDDDMLKSSSSRADNSNNQKKTKGKQTGDDGSDDESTKKPNEPVNANSFAAQMMASMTTLKATSEKQKEENEKKRLEEEAEQQRLEEERQNKAAKKAPYRPQETIVIQTAATNKKLQVHKLPTSDRRVLTVKRPEEVQEARYDLPVAQMEFEVIDAIRNHDVTIICGETGSGKSTQIPQLVYESGFTLGGPKKQDSKYLIGITQPRRVAAVSTAKRVSYEMGTGDGQTIKSPGKRSDGNLVSYQTRYESAGLGQKTAVKFMTDGILLQEIQSDLLLRKYSVIVLDECHERNLNCDILCGLIGLALPLRKKAAEEPGSDIVPLKLVIMSATLRVNDFVNNKKLFPSTDPFVLKVPGRTFPVTVHHNKMTELDDYEDAAFQKVCKIHRTLPQGGVLVFLTGKHEIVRMVNRLRKALSPKKKRSTSQIPFLDTNDVATAPTDITFASESAPRDLDDDEVDGDLFNSDNEDDDFDDAEADDAVFQPLKDKDGASDNIPKDLLVLPLYSMLSSEEQARIFAGTPEGCRLIVVSTNIAETSITIPSMSYVVDTGRQKCKSYDAKTGVASFDISWISKAAANQRAGRAGRTGPGHCYRLYSSSMFSRQMDDFALPEVLTRPLEDVVLAMKSMKISSVSKFPFPTPPAASQVDAAVKMLANVGCLQLNAMDIDGDGEITPLGAAVATFPLGVRCGKMLLVAAHAGVLDYAIAIVAALSENNPFDGGGDHNTADAEEDGSDDDDDASSGKEPKKKKVQTKWAHYGGDVYAVMLAIGAYTYAGKGAGGMSEKVACKQFCQENGLNSVTMERIQKIRVHLSRLVKTRMAGAEGIAAKTGKIPHSMKPPNKLQERLLLQVIVAGMLDNIAMMAPVGSIPGSHPFSLRSAFLSCSSSIKEPLFMDRKSVLFSRDSRHLPQWVCYDYLVRKIFKDGIPIATMKNVTPVDASCLAMLAKGSKLLSLGAPMPSPRPTYDADKDEIVCSVETKFGTYNWEIPPLKIPMYDALRTHAARKSMHFELDDSYRYFGRFLLEGKVIADLQELGPFLNDSPSIITDKKPVGKVGLLVSALSDAEVDTVAKLRQHWSTVDNKFLFKTLKSWVKPKCSVQAKKLWIATVKKECAR